MKTVGIITMHRVVNYGSALQAWATQEIIRRLGYSPKIIDYIYPNVGHETRRTPISLLIMRFFKNLIQRYPIKRKKRYFEKYWNDNYDMTSMYTNERQLKENPPLFDTYLVGSDQVWNFDYIKNDSSFFLSFAPENKRKLSYASSFSKGNLNLEQRQRLKSYLESFKAVSVREKNGFDIVNSINQGIVAIHLDPTLLLREKDYQRLISKSTITIDSPYILVYVLNYAFNPYPYATHFIEYAAQTLRMKVVCIDFSARQHLKVKGMKHLHDAIGPSEFLWLFSHASLVVTTSFHGTAFAINFNKPFYSIINDADNGDDRIKNLIKQCGAEERMLIKGSALPPISLDVNFSNINRKLKELRVDSINYLKSNI